MYHVFSFDQNVVRFSQNDFMYTDIQAAIGIRLHGFMITGQHGVSDLGRMFFYTSPVR